MKTLTFEELVSGIRLARTAGEVSSTQKNRARIEAQGITIADCFKAMDDGEAYPAKEIDRVKYVDDKVVVFVLLGSKDKEGEVTEHAYIISAFKKVI
jgi:hypothetical protein